MAKANNDRSWNRDQDQLRQDADVVRHGGGISWSCPCGQTFTIEGGMDTAGKMEAISKSHLNVDHPGVLEEFQQMRELGIHRDFAEVFIEQWRKEVKGGG